MPWIIAACIVLAACSKDDGGGGASAAKLAAGGTGAREAVLEAWTKAGLKPAAFAPATVAFGKDCQSGTVNNIDVIVCVYPSPVDAAAAKDPGFEWVGESTGSAVVSGAVMVAIADRRKADPTGKAINQLMKALPK